MHWLRGRRWPGTERPLARPFAPAESGRDRDGPLRRCLHPARARI